MNKKPKKLITKSFTNKGAKQASEILKKIHNKIPDRKNTRGTMEDYLLIIADGDSLGNEPYVSVNYYTKDELIQLRNILNIIKKEEHLLYDTARDDLIMYRIKNDSENNGLSRECINALDNYCNYMGLDIDHTQHPMFSTFIIIKDRIEITFEDL